MRFSIRVHRLLSLILPVFLAMGMLLFMHRFVSASDSVAAQKRVQAESEFTIENSTESNVPSSEQRILMPQISGDYALVQPDLLVVNPNWDYHDHLFSTCSTNGLDTLSCFIPQGSTDDQGRVFTVTTQLPYVGISFVPISGTAMTNMKLYQLLGIDRNWNLNIGERYCFYSSTSTITQEDLDDLGCSNSAEDPFDNFDPSDYPYIYVAQDCNFGCNASSFTIGNWRWIVDKDELQYLQDSMLWNANGECRICKPGAVGNIAGPMNTRTGNLSYSTLAKIELLTKK
jgi:hypothetical protein